VAEDSWNAHIGYLEGGNGQDKINMLTCISLKTEMPMTYQERYEKTNVWIARRIVKDLMLMKGKNEIVSEHDEQTIGDAEGRDAAMRQMIKPQARPSLLA
jgi:hypothetical protein